MIYCLSRSFKVNQQYGVACVGVGADLGKAMLTVSRLTTMGKSGQRVQKLLEGFDRKAFTLSDALDHFRDRLGDKATKKLVVACLCVALSKFLCFICCF